VKVAFGAIFVLAVAATASSQSSSMAIDVLKLVRAAHRLPRLMPWSGPVSEVDLVARHGKAVVPQLMLLLPEDPDDPKLAYDHWDEGRIIAGQQFDWYVEQQAAMALCKIYIVPMAKIFPVPLANCPIYSNRAMPEQNRQVRIFWLKMIADNP